MAFSGLQTTALTLTATPGQTSSFVAKTETISAGGGGPAQGLGAVAEISTEEGIGGGAFFKEKTHHEKSWLN